MVPWIRTFIGRISALRCDNEKVCNQLKTDCYKMARQYNMVLSDELDPYKCLLIQINSERYDAVEKLIS